VLPLQASDRVTLFAPSLKLSFGAVTVTDLPVVLLAVVALTVTDLP
jgi:hypothetical protein